MATKAATQIAEKSMERDGSTMEVGMGRLRAWGGGEWRKKDGSAVGQGRWRYGAWVGKSEEEREKSEGERVRLK